MLTQEIKKKIDSARDILVGKVPDPKAQVEQITTALIYKFMDDMDKESMSLPKGKARFFTNGYEKYAWNKLMDPKVGGYERLNLYVEAITRMSQNPHLPQLFREIFKDAFLPYRDPETLNLFLKEINGFAYDNSENLGDAYEYLLSILGSQGEAGQFRTPRHIIDFIVEVVNPKNDESILDPACGTAGFLISAYKHILNSNKDRPLTPDEKKRLMMNLVGYDISPDMVRISLVNMYLHGFPNPNIYEYDTLTNEERWDDRFDVIMANPPFMTPKGGIRPHKRFSVQANRSEVLFVDYIIEHLNIKGRAGFIVPEGIIFQSSNAYKQLRKKLLEDGLYAVVSLPAGVFNPYSGVKTSILFFDNDLAKRSKEFLFVKVFNDGFDLGAQRRPIDKNDLPYALKVIKAQQIAIQTGSKNTSVQEGNLFAWTVSKEKIAENGDYGLSGDRYLITTHNENIKWQMVALDEVLEYEQPTKYIVNSVDYDDKHTIPVLTAGKTFILGYTNENEGVFKEKLPVIIFDDFTTATKFVDFPFKVKSSAMKILHAKKEKADIKFLFYVMQRVRFESNEHKRYWISEYSKITIPLPPLEIQEQIVAELDGYQNIINGAKQITANWKPKIDIDPEWEKVKLGEVCDFVRGPFGGSLKKEIFVTNGYAVYEQSHAIYGDFSDFRYFIDEEKFREMKRFEIKPNELIMSCSGTMGKTAIVPDGSKKGVINQALLKLTPHKELGIQFLKLWMDSDDFQNQLLSNVSGAAIQNVASVKVLQNINVSLPPLEIQKQIVLKIEKEHKMVEVSEEMGRIFKQKIKSKISEVWGEKI